MATHEELNLKRYDRTHRTESIKMISNSHKLHVHLCGPDARTNSDSILVICVHGFPELGFSWRKQWLALSSLGLSVLSPDMRGYGNSHVFSNIEDYSFEKVTQDLIDLVRIFKRRKALFIGHDFGGSIVWSVGQHHPDVCLGIVGVNTPLDYHLSHLAEVSAAGGPTKLLLTLPSRQCGHLDYQAYFQYAGDDELNANPERTMNAYFRSQISGNRERDKRNMQLGMRTNRCREPLSEANPQVPRGVLGVCPEVIERDPLWSQFEIDYYARAFAKSKFPLKYYRAIDLNWKWDRDSAREQLLFPCLMVTAEYDAVLTPESSNNMERRIPDLTRKHLVCGHWSQVERTEELNQALQEFIRAKFLLERSKL